MNLRPYQLAAVEAVFRQWEDVQSTLIVLPTGTGKTQIFADVIRRKRPARALVLVHRAELAYQAQARIEKIAGVECAIEMAEMRAATTLWARPQCVIASVQSLYKRLDQFKPEDFGVLVCDEAHHCTAPSWRKIIDHFKANTNLKILGVTATPDRADEEALGQIFQSVAYDYEILDAIKDGWLLPVDQQMVTLGDLDFSNVKVTKNENGEEDLNGVDLAKIMEREACVQGMVAAALDIIGDKSTLLFAVSVKHAEMACEILNRWQSGMAEFIFDGTDRDKRKRILERFQSGKTQVLANCAIATEGFDAPAAAIVLNGRPTKSRALYAQIAGRVLRPLSGLVDGLATPEERRAAIAASPKPVALLVDFVGNSGRHKLMTSADILGGNVSDEAIELATANAKATRGSVSMVEMLEDAQKQLEKEKAEREAKRLADMASKKKVRATTTYSKVKVDPFSSYNIFDLKPVKTKGWHRGKILTEPQRAWLLKCGFNPDKLSFAEAKAYLDDMGKRIETKLCSYPQARTLSKYGYDAARTKTMTYAEAHALLDKIAANGWKTDMDKPF